MPSYHDLPGTYKDPYTGIETPVIVKISKFLWVEKGEIETTYNVESIVPREV